MRASFRQLGRRVLPALPLLPLLLICLALAGCDTAEERAEAHYQRGMALLAAGDADRALVEFRNVFRLDGAHIPARLAYAKVERDRGETREAIGQYLRVADQDPANLEAQRAVIEIALQMQDFATAEEHAAEAFVQAPADPEVRALKATVDFRHPGTRAAAVEMARGVVAEDPGIVAAQMVLIADRLNAGAPKEALPLIDAALAQDPRRPGPAPGAARDAGAARRHSRQRRRARSAWPRSSPTIPACARRWCSGTCAPATPPAPRRCCAPRRRAPPADPQAALTLAQFLLEVRGPRTPPAPSSRRASPPPPPTPARSSGRWPGSTSARAARTPAIAALRQLARRRHRRPTAPATCRWRWRRCWPRPAALAESGGAHRHRARRRSQQPRRR